MTTSNQKLLINIINDNHRELLFKLLFRYNYGLEMVEEGVAINSVLFSKFKRIVEVNVAPEKYAKSTDVIDSGQLRQMLNWLESDYVPPVKRTVNNIVVTADSGKIQIQATELTKQDLTDILNDLQNVDIGNPEAVK